QATIVSVRSSVIVRGIESGSRGDLPVIGNEREWADGGVVKDRGRERPSAVGAGVEVEPVWTHVGSSLVDDRMAMDDVLAMIAHIGKERFADPQHRLLRLLVERRSGFDSAMSAEAFHVAARVGKGFEPTQGFARHLLRG